MSRCRTGGKALRLLALALLSWRRRGALPFHLGTIAARPGSLRRRSGCRNTSGAVGPFSLRPSAKLSLPCCDFPGFLWHCLCSWLSVRRCATGTGVSIRLKRPVSLRCRLNNDTGCPLTIQGVGVQNHVKVGRVVGGSPKELPEESHSGFLCLVYPSLCFPQ